MSRVLTIGFAFLALAVAAATIALLRPTISLAQSGECDPRYASAEFEGVCTIDQNPYCVTQAGCIDLLNSIPCEEIGEGFAATAGIFVDVAAVGSCSATSGEGCTQCERLICATGTAYGIEIDGDCNFECGEVWRWVAQKCND